MYIHKKKYITAPVVIVLIPQLGLSRWGFVFTTHRRETESNEFQLLTDHGIDAFLTWIPTGVSGVGSKSIFFVDTLEINTCKQRRNIEWDLFTRRPNKDMCTVAFVGMAVECSKLAPPLQKKYDMPESEPVTNHPSIVDTFRIQILVSKTKMHDRSLN